jgi:hypothetical protein
LCIHIFFLYLNKQNKHIMKTQIRQITEENRYRFTGSTKANFAGNFTHELHAGDYVIFNLDEFDTQYYSGVSLKAGEKLFRYQTNHHRHFGGATLVKVNVERGLVYFLTEQGLEQDEPIFETRGIKIRWMNLI